MLSRTGQTSIYRGFLRWTLETAILLGIFATLFSTWLLEGLLVPIVVTSGSMAPTLLGPHRIAACPNCGMTFSYEADGTTNGNDEAFCPNCGLNVGPLLKPIISGDRLLIDRGSFAWRKPRRWEVALFRCPDRATDYCVKRIVGLPGETIDIRDGDVYVNDHIARKALAEQRAMAILVHDTAWASGAKGQGAGVSDERPPFGSEPQGRRQTASSSLSPGAPGAGVRAAPPTRWQTDSGWRATTTGYTSDRSPTPHWLSLRGPIRDDDAYNPQSSRQLNDVTDLMLVAHVSADGPGQLVIVGQRGADECQVTLAPSTGEMKLQYNRGAPTTTPVDKNCLREPKELVVSMIDSQLIVALAGRTIVTIPVESVLPVIAASDRPFAIAAQNLTARIDRLQVWRDVYVTASSDPKTSTTCKLADGEYFVLGDNSPMSQDSRHWTGGAPFNERLLIGKPLCVFRRE